MNSEDKDYDVKITFDYLGLPYTYDLSKKLKVSPVTDNDRRLIAGEIGFISAVLANYIVQKHQLQRLISNTRSKSEYIDKARISLQKKENKSFIPYKEIQTYIDNNPEMKSLQKKIYELEDKIIELEQIKWSLISKKEMLQVIRD